ncbi:MAG: hypothetical protein ACWA5P_03415 [bacterium]
MSKKDEYDVDWERIDIELNFFYIDEVNNSKFLKKNKKIRNMLLETTGASNIVKTESIVDETMIGKELSDYEKLFLELQISQTNKIRSMLMEYYKFSKKRADKYSASRGPTTKSSSKGKGWARCEDCCGKKRCPRMYVFGCG